MIKVFAIKVFAPTAALALMFLLAPAAASAETVVLTATLTGANEVGGGAPDGNGAFRVEVNTETGEFGYTL